MLGSSRALEAVNGSKVFRSRDGELWHIDEQAVDRSQEITVHVNFLHRVL